MLIRPHHLLCVGSFQGKGYSPEFTAHMTAVIAMLQEQTAVTLICACDAICEACPNRCGEHCDAEEKVQRYDRAVLQYCGLQENESLPWGMLQSIAKQHAVPHLQEICAGCHWYAICAKAAAAKIRS